VRACVNQYRRSSSSDAHEKQSIQGSVDLSTPPKADVTSNPPQTLDETSARSLLRENSYATTTDYNASKGLPELTTAGETRQRQGFKGNLGSNIHQLWRQKSFGILSQRTFSTFDGNFAHGKPGWWHKQMLVDRSLRSMAVFTAGCAVIMFIIVLCYVPAFTRRTNKASTSVGGRSGESCHKAESRNVVRIAQHAVLTIC
jgi:hypothetical protein